jgi:hypothetical protein
LPGGTPAIPLITLDVIEQPMMHAAHRQQVVYNVFLAPDRGIAEMVDVHGRLTTHHAAVVIERQPRGPLGGPQVRG